jgi:hypothetical protein
MSIFDRQTKTIHSFTLFIDYCIKFNGGIMDSNEEETTLIIKKLINFLCGMLLYLTSKTSRSQERRGTVDEVC